MLTEVDILNLTILSLKSVCCHSSDALNSDDQGMVEGSTCIFKPSSECRQNKKLDLD